jgi:oligopeptidase B
MDQIAPTPPVARKQPCIIEQLGRTRTDDFRWMKDDNWQAVLRDPTRLNPEIRAHLLAENAYTKAVLANTEMLQQTLAREMQARIKQDDASVPMQDGAYAYYRRYEPGAQHPVFARRPHGGAEEILLDADAAAKGLAYYRVAAAAHSPDHRLFAYAADGQGSEVYEIRIKNLETGALLPEMISPSTGNFAFSPCSRFIFWTYRNENGRPAKIFCRRVGWAEDRLVYEEKDEGFYISVEAAASGGSI